eukprot:scaffold91257_cov65-Phaeocystis_antarctica.AAC.2
MSASTAHPGRSRTLDPVFTMDGFTYERAAITEWLASEMGTPHCSRAPLWREGACTLHGGRGGFESIGDGSMPPDAAALAGISNYVRHITSAATSALSSAVAAAAAS